MGQKDSLGWRKISSYLWVCTDQNKMGHLTLEQRYKIETYLSLRRNKIEIAAYIGKDKSVISREIKRNADARNGVYKAALADKKAKFRHQTKAKRSEERRVGKECRLKG